MKATLFSLAAFALLVCTVSPQLDRTSSIRNYRVANEHRLLSDFVQFLSIPNVASDAPNISRNANYLVEQMRTRGLKPRLLSLSDTSVPPAVYGEWLTPGVVRTIIFYAHYDGQPVDPKAWTATEPF